jgi:hypothetical protein
MVERCRKISVGGAVEIIVCDSGLSTAMFNTFCCLALSQWLAFGRTKRWLANAMGRKQCDKGCFAMIVRCKAWGCSDAGF